MVWGVTEADCEAIAREMNGKEPGFTCRVQLNGTEVQLTRISRTAALSGQHKGERILRCDTKQTVNNDGLMLTFPVSIYVLVSSDLDR